MRRRDFLADHAGDETTEEEYAERAATRLNGRGGGAALPVYLASDVAEDLSTQAAFRKFFPRVVTLLQVVPPLGCLWRVGRGS